MRNLVCLLIASVCFGATHYVATTGDDDNPGTEELPWQTCVYAMGHTTYGDSVRVKAGAYGENLYFHSSHNHRQTWVAYGGDVTVNQVTFHSAVGVVLDGFKVVWSVEGRFAAAVKPATDSCVIKNCDISIDPPHAFTLRSGIQGSGSHITIDNCVIHGTVMGTYLSGDHITVTNCTVYDNWHGGIEYRLNVGSVDSGEIAYNVIYGNGLDDGGGPGILVQGNDNWIHHNLVYNNGYNSAGWGIRLMLGDGNDSCHGNEIANNVIVNNWSYGVYVEPVKVCSNLIRNNIVVSNNNRVLQYMNSGVVSDYNCFHTDGASAFDWAGGGPGTFAAYRAATGFDASGLCSDPFVVDTATYDYHLTDSSPCIDAGDPTTPVGLDFDGVWYGGSNTPIGAFQDTGDLGYISAISTPSGAAVSLDGYDTSSTPVTFDNVPAGDHIVELTYPFYYSYTDTVTVTSGDTAEVNGVLTPYDCYISATSTPAGAALWVDGVNTDSVTPVVVQSSVGDHEVKFTLTGYDDYTDSVTITAGDTAAATGTMIRHWLDVGSVTFGAATGKKLTVGGTSHGRVRGARMVDQ